MAANDDTTGALPATANARLQFWGLVVHSGILVLLIVATTVLTLTHHFSADAAIGVFGSIAGFSGSAASYRAGVRHGDDRGS